MHCSNSAIVLSKNQLPAAEYCLAADHCHFYIDIIVEYH